MSVHYLVDYENVHDSGLYGMDRLTAEDRVYIFHTSSTDRISLSRLENVQARMKVILVPPGKQSLDMHLGSYLGYLIGQGNDGDVFAVVSHDTDYRGIAGFWNSSYRTEDKVKCIHGINYPLGIAAPKSSAPAPAPVPAAAVTPRIAVHEYILRVFSKFASVSQKDGPCMQVSLLCDRLNRLPEYKQDRERLGLKPRQYLEQECRDILWIRRMYGVDWAYLLAAPVGEPFVTDTVDEPVLAGACAAGAVPAAGEHEAELSASEEEVPDFPDLSDLCIDTPDITEPPFDPDLPADTVPAEPDYAGMAEEVLRSADVSERDAFGRVRASVLRDRLMKVPEFSAAQKESGLKPILYMQLLFAGKIEIRRENGIFWASSVGSAAAGSADAEENGRPVKDEVSVRRKRNFYDAAFTNIREKLSGAGFDPAVADEIAVICMRSEGEEEPRKVIHTLLCREFGNKVGAKYYRQAVKYICA